MLGKYLDRMSAKKLSNSESYSISKILEITICVLIFMLTLTSMKSANIFFYLCECKSTRNVLNSSDTAVRAQGRRNLGDASEVKHAEHCVALPFPECSAAKLFPCLHKSLSFHTREEWSVLPLGSSTQEPSGRTDHPDHSRMLLCFIRTSDSPAIGKPLLDQASWLPYHWYQLCKKSCIWAHSAGRGFKQCRFHFSVATSNFGICLYVPCLRFQVPSRSWFYKILLHFPMCMG